MPRSRRLLEIERETLLAAIEREEVGGRLAHEGADPARVVAAAGRLDLDHARTQVGEHLGAERTGQHARQIDDEDPGERARSRHRLAAGTLEALLERGAARRAGPSAGARRTARSARDQRQLGEPARRRRRAAARPDPRASGREPLRSSAPGAGRRPIGVSTALRGALAALEDPLEHAAVLAVARPQELAVRALAEPVHVVDARQLRASRACPISSQCAK